LPDDKEVALGPPLPALRALAQRLHEEVEGT
jgi:hypothetical protein